MTCRISPAQRIALRYERDEMFFDFLDFHLSPIHLDLTLFLIVLALYFLYTSALKINQG